MNEQKQNAKLRERARINNQQWFTPSGPCAKGHDAPRSVATGKCRECTRAAGRKHLANKQKTDWAKKIAFAKEARAEAIANGEIMYRSGRDCPNGHRNPWRYITAYNCVECNSERQVELAKERRKNRVHLPKKKRGRPKKVHKVKTHKEPIITKQDRQDESFNELIKRVYERNSNW